MNASPAAASRFLIIAGSPKAGTTSLFVYLRDHPEVCACRVKEPRYFMPVDDFVPIARDLGNRPLDDYLRLFDCPAEASLRMEASPEYFYSAGVAERIRQALPGARVTVSLREPISRLISWYRFSGFTGERDAALSFDQFLEQQRNDRRPVNQRSPYLRGLDTGRYARTLAHWFEVLGRERVHPFWFSDLETDPRKVMQQLCRFCGIDPEYFSRYSFRPLNQTIEVRSTGILDAYTRVRRGARHLLGGFPSLRRVLRSARGKLDPWVLRLAARPPPKVILSEQTRQFLLDYYRPDALALAELLDEPPPWAAQYGVTS